MKQVAAVVDASNLRVGGGVQVASSFISEVCQPDLLHEYPWLSDTRIFVSPEVASNLGQVERGDERILIRATKPLSRRPSVDLMDNAVWFDIFGAAVQRAVPCRRLVGFADVTSIYSQPGLSPTAAARRAIRSLVSLRSFRSADHIVVETDAVRQRLIKFNMPGDRISVVPNCFHPVFNSVPSEFEVKMWQERFSLTAPDSRILLYVARAYPHKNHDFLGDVAEVLPRLDVPKFKFVVTLSEGEWRARSENFRRHVLNVGPLSVQEHPALYAAADAAIFPSLLECFSATPLEALRTGTPLFASDRDFVRTVVGNHAQYFDPLDAYDCARVIASYLRDPNSVLQEAEAGRRLAARAPGSGARALEYLRIMNRLRLQP